MEQGRSTKIMAMINWIRASRLLIKSFLPMHAGAQVLNRFSRNKALNGQGKMVKFDGPCRCTCTRSASSSRTKTSPSSASPRSSFFFISLEPRVEWYNNLLALNTSPESEVHPLKTLQGYLAHKKHLTPIGSPQGPRHSPNVGS